MPLLHDISSSLVEGQDTLNLLGGKGYNLCKLWTLTGLVPPALIIPTTECVDYLYGSHEDRTSLYIEEILAKFPLVNGGCMVSVRSGARVSMAGMMDTVLNVGITEDNLDIHAKRLGLKVALRCYLRFILMYSSIVEGITEERLKTSVSLHDVDKFIDKDLTELSVRQLNKLITHYLNGYEAVTECKFPNTVEEQLRGCILAVFKSWDSDRAMYYRKVYNIPNDWGTAVTIQKMVFGNINEKSCTGVLFTRCPSTGKNELTGEVLFNAQGEDVVAGIKTPENFEVLAGKLPYAYNKLCHTAYALEGHFNDVQDIEFTIQDEELFILQTRNAKRSPSAALTIALDFAQEHKKCVKSLKGFDLSKYLSFSQFLDASVKKFKTTNNLKPDFVGISASIGVATGVLITNLEEHEHYSSQGFKTIFIAKETTPDDIELMHKTIATITCLGGATSHAAVVARSMGKVCVVGCHDLTYSNDGFILNNKMIEVGTTVSVDGTSGSVWLGSSFDIEDGKQDTLYKLLPLALELTESSRLMLSMPDLVLLKDFVSKHKDIAYYLEITSVNDLSLVFGNFDYNLPVDIVFYREPESGFIEDLKDTSYWKNVATCINGFLKPFCDCVYTSHKGLHHHLKEEDKIKTCFLSLDTLIKEIDSPFALKWFYKELAPLLEAKGQKMPLNYIDLLRSVLW